MAFKDKTCAPKNKKMAEEGKDRRDKMLFMGHWLQAMGAEGFKQRDFHNGKSSFAELSGVKCLAGSLNTWCFPPPPALLFLFFCIKLLDDYVGNIHSLIQVQHV